MSPTRRHAMVAGDSTRYWLAGMARGARIAQMSLARGTYGETRTMCVRMARQWNWQMIRDLKGAV